MNIQYINPIELRPFLKLKDFKEIARRAKGIRLAYNVDNWFKIAGPQDDGNVKTIIASYLKSEKGLNWEMVKTVPLSYMAFEYKNTGDKVETFIAMTGHLVKFDDKLGCWVQGSEATVKDLEKYPIFVNSIHYTERDFKHLDF